MTDLPRTARFLAALHTTPATTGQPRLHHLLDRLRRGVLLEAEAEALAGLVGELEVDLKEASTTRDLEAARGDRLYHFRNRWAAHAGRLIGRAVTAEARVAELEAEVTRLTAGQCTHTRAMCDLHHTAPVDGCPYPKCKTAREQQRPPAHLAKGTNAEDCPACKGTNPPYPFLCPGPTTA